MINLVRLLVATGALLIGSMALATPAQAYESTSCYDGVDGVPVCTTTWAPAPPPPDHLKPAPLPPPGLDNSPCEAVSCQPPPAAPAPVYVAPAPYVPAPAAPAPIYKQPVAPAPVYVAPVPVQGQTAITPGQSAVAPAVVDGEAIAAPESVQEAVEATATASEAATPSADVVAAPIKQSVRKPVQDIEDSGTIVAAADQVSSDAVDSTPIVLFVTLVVAGTFALVVILRFGPGISGVRGMVRIIMRR